MMLHQDGSVHEWVPGRHWDLIVMMDDATSERYSMFFMEEGTASSFQGVEEVIFKHGLFCSLYTDRGSHYWHAPKAGGKVDKSNLAQFGRAMHPLGIEMIAAHLAAKRCMELGRLRMGLSSQAYKDAKEMALELFHRDYLGNLLKETGGNVTQAAKKCGMERQNLQQILRRSNIAPQDFRD